MNRIKTLIKILYIKWVQGECRHFCYHCKYSDECFENLESDGIKNVVPNINHSVDYEYHCLSCDLLFNALSNNHFHNPYYKIVTLDYTIKKSLAFPKLIIDIANDDTYSRCLFGIVPDSLNCDNIDCDDCIFGKENYRMYTDVNKRTGRRII